MSPDRDCGNYNDQTFVPAQALPVRHGYHTSAGTDTESSLFSPERMLSYINKYNLDALWAYLEMLCRMERDLNPGSQTSEKPDTFRITPRKFLHAFEHIDDWAAAIAWGGILSALALSVGV